MSASGKEVGGVVAAAAAAAAAVGPSGDGGAGPSTSVFCQPGGAAMQSIGLMKNTIIVETVKSGKDAAFSTF